MQELLVIFLTGLTTGGLSCLALQGGLLASVIASQKEEEHEELITARKLKSRHHNLDLDLSQLEKQASVKTFDQLDWLPVLMFLGTKIISHTILGFLLGLIGSALTLSLGVRLAFQVFTALFMFATAMNLLNVHPIFRYVMIQPPHFLLRMVKNTSKSRALFAPGLLGLLTIFVPCGVTQAMEVLAISTGNPLQGALIMFAFVLGTSPLFAILGVATAKLSEGWYLKFTKIAATVLILMTVYSLNGVLLVLNSPISLSGFLEPIFASKKEQTVVAAQEAPTQNQKVTINVQNNGYNPRYIKVKRGIPVDLTLQSKDVYSCALSFILPKFGINTFLKTTDKKTFTFTPQDAGKYRFTCSMGMYSGTIEVL